MSLLNTFLATAKTGESKERSMAVAQRLLQYIICTGLGLLGGAMGVALAIGGAITIQSLLFPAAIFVPGVVPVAVAAVLIGLGVSWLFGWVANRILPGLFYNSGLQVILIFSAFISLLETFLFLQRL
ncbi:hypothetical protein ACFLXQ_07695 [Chloroflexota bacterium]